MRIDSNNIQQTCETNASQNITENLLKKAAAVQNYPRSKNYKPKAARPSVLSKLTKHKIMDSKSSTDRGTSEKADILREKLGEKIKKMLQ